MLRMLINKKDRKFNISKIKKKSKGKLNYFNRLIMHWVIRNKGKSTKDMVRMLSKTLSKSLVSINIQKRITIIILGIQEKAKK